MFEIPENLKHQKLIFEAGEKQTLLVAEKNSAYGSAFEQITKLLEQLFPNGIPVHKYGDVSILIRMLDKVCRIANEQENFNNEDAWDDIMGYAMIAKVSKLKAKKD